MGGMSDVLKRAVDPAHLLTNKNEPVTLKSFAQGIHGAFDPVSAVIGNKIAKHNNTQDNLRGYMDPGQIFGPNATQAPGPNPNSPGSIMNFGGAGTGQRMPFNPSLGVPANGVSTNGLQQPQYPPQQPMQPQLQGGFNPQGGTPNFGMQNGPAQGAPQGGPNWSSIIAQALQGPTKQTAGQGMPIGPRFNA